MEDRPTVPAWFESITNYPSVVGLLKQLYLSNGVDIHELNFLGRSASDSRRGEFALYALLAGSRSKEVLVAAVAHCLSLGLDPPLIEGIYGNWTDAERLATTEALYDVVVQMDALKAEMYAVKAVRLGSMRPEIRQSFARRQYRHGYFEELLGLKPPLRGSSMQTLLAKATDDAKLLRYGFSMPQPHQIRPLTDAIANKVLFFLHTSRPYASVGYATRTHGMLTGLAARGVDVSAVTRLGYPGDQPGASPGEPVPLFDDVDGVRYHRTSGSDEVYGKSPIVSYLKANILAHLPLIQREKPGVLHAASNFVNGVAATFLAKRFDLASVYEVRGLWELTRAAREPEYPRSDSFRGVARMETEACCNADRVICITNALKMEMVRRGVPAEKITVVPNGVHTARFNVREPDGDLCKRFGILQSDVVIGYVGSTIHYEGLDTLIWALHKLRANGHRNLRLLIVGDGDALEPLKELAQGLGLSENATFAGRVPHDAVERYYSLISIAPFPRRPLAVCEIVSPLKPLEAMAMEKCVIVSSVAALAEMVEDGVTGLIFEKGDADSLARVLEIAITRPDLRRSLGVSARRWVMQHRDWKVLASQVIDIYADLAAERAGSAAVDSAIVAPDVATVPAYLYGFFSTNVGDAAVTHGAIELARRAGLAEGGTVVAPVSGATRRAWAPIEARFPNLKLHERELRLRPSENRDPVDFLETALATPDAQRRVLAHFGIADATHGLYTGGEHLFSLGRPEDDWNILARLLPMLALARLRRRTLFLPVTIGPLASDFSRAIVREALTQAVFSAVRDELSRMEVTSLGLPAPAALLDPAFFLLPDKPFPVTANKIDHRLISIVMRLDGFGMRVGPRESEARIAALETEGYTRSTSYGLYREIGSKLLQSGYDLRFFIQCFADDRPTRLLAEDLQAEFSDRRIMINKPTSPGNMIHDLATGAGTITSRFHAAIFSLISGCPAIGIHFSEHGHKMPGLFAMLGMECACFDGRHASAKSIVKETLGRIGARHEFQDETLQLLDGKRAETLRAYRPHLEG